MTFTEFKPHDQLTHLIDAYWDIACKEGEMSTHKVFPDGCLDLIINLGDDYRIDYGGITLKNERAYLGGAITHFQEATTVHETHLVGVRFKPSAFSHFFAFSSLHEITNEVVEVSHNYIPRFELLSNDISSSFDSFFYNKLSKPKRSLLPIIDTIEKYGASICVNELADVHATTVRQLERSFRYHIGLSPKEFINITRYRLAQQLIKRERSKRSLADIAFECGFYDQAHLSNEIKRYTGVVPSSL